MPKKKEKKPTIKLIGLERALEGPPQRERAGVAAEILEMFRDFDPENPPGEPVVRLEPGTRVCPRCDGVLTELAVLPRPDGKPDRELVLECEACDATFSEPLLREPS
ncbi:MAG TPA: hypothetical protein VHU80_05205 [Polyangiaceae bacterium]|nr:hypothetical protein [Polyangiaceae bacterium]